MIFRIITFLPILTFLLPGFLNAEDSRLNVILKRGELRVSVNKTYEPMYIEEPNDGFPGFDVEMAYAYAEYLGVKVKIIPLVEFEENVSGINKGDIDICIFGFTSNLGRSKEITFTDPYLITSAAGLVNKSVLPPEPEGQLIATKPFKDLFDLLTQSGISIAVKSPSAPQRFLVANFSKFPIFSYLSYDLALDALKRNNVNCFVAEGLYIEALLQKVPSLRSNYLPLLNPVSEEHVSIMIPKNDIILLHNLNFFIKEMKRTGRINQIRFKYFSSNGWVKKS